MIIFEELHQEESSDFLYLGTDITFDVKNLYSGYSNLTENNFYIKNIEPYSTSRGDIQTYADGQIRRKGEIIKQYDFSTGTLTCYARYYYRASDSNGTGDKVDEKIKCETYLRLPNATKQFIDLGTGTSFDVKTKYPNYSSLTEDNFCIKTSQVYDESRSTIFGYADRDPIRRQMRLEKSYDSSTGVLTCYLKYYYHQSDSNGTGDKVDKNIEVNVFLSEEILSDKVPNYTHEISSIILGYGQEYLELIPAMTSNIEPKGIVSASRYFNNNTLPYMAFDKQNNTKWQIAYTQSATTSDYLMYTFDKPKKINKWTCIARKEVGGSTTISVKAILTDDSEIIIGNFTETDSSTYQEFNGDCDIENVKAIKLQPMSFSSYSQININDFQVYSYAGGEQIQSVMLGDKFVFGGYTIPIDTHQQKTAGAGYSSGTLEWNGDYANSKISKIIFNEQNVGLHSGDEWMRTIIVLKDGQEINDEWGNGVINKDYSRTTNSGIPYNIRVEDKNVTFTFDKDIQVTKISYSCYTKYGTWRSEGFNLNLYVTGLLKG